MQIQLTGTLGIDPKHGMIKGRIFDVAEEHRHSGRGNIHWSVIGDCGERVGVFRREAVVVRERPEPSITP